MPRFVASLTFLLSAIFTAAAATAQPTITVATVPPNPVAGGPFSIAVTATCYSVGPASVAGSTITVPFTSSGLCVTLPPITEESSVPALAAGTYTINVVNTADNSVLVTAQVVVAPAVPALDPPALAMLVISLLAIGAFLLRGR